MSTSNVTFDDLVAFLEIPQGEIEAMEPHERLRAVREKHYETAADAARAMGIEAGTYRAHEEGRGTFKHLPRYAKFFGVTLEFLALGKLPSKTGTEAKHQPIVDNSLEGLQVKGFVHAGVWQESYAPEGEVTTVPVAAIAGFPRERTYALQIKGDSINRRAKDGSYAICVEWHGIPVTGDVVVVEKRKNGFFQATIKEVRVRNGKIELWPDSDSPAHQDPIIVKKEDLEDGEEVAVVAKVLFFMVDPRRA